MTNVVNFFLKPDKEPDVIEIVKHVFIQHLNFSYFIPNVALQKKPTTFIKSPCNGV